LNSISNDQEIYSNGSRDQYIDHSVT